MAGTEPGAFLSNWRALRCQVAGGRVQHLHQLRPPPGLLWRTTASPGVEYRPIRPGRADPPPKTSHTTTATGTTTTNPAKRTSDGVAQALRTRSADRSWPLE